VWNVVNALIILKSRN